MWWVVLGWRWVVLEMKVGIDGSLVDALQGDSIGTLTRTAGEGGAMRKGVRGTCRELMSAALTCFRVIVGGRG